LDKADVEDEVEKRQEEQVDLLGVLRGINAKQDTRAAAIVIAAAIVHIKHAAILVLCSSSSSSSSSQRSVVQEHVDLLLYCRTLIADS